MINNQISNFIKKRRSIFPHQFNGQEIDKNIIIELLKNANTAPTHKLTQPWFFKIFSKSSKIKLAQVLSEHNRNSEEYAQKILSKFNLSSHIICVCMRRDQNKSIPE